MSQEKWEKEGQVYLPLNQGFTKMIIGKKGKKGRPGFPSNEIKGLNLMMNSVREVEGVENLSGVEWVWASGCGFTAFPDWIMRLPLIEYLFIDHNDIPEIPISIMAKETLIELYANSNRRMSSISSPGPILTYLSISDCDIKSLPSDLFHYALLDVDLSGNPGE